jgi:hypothetical protein
MMMHVHRERRTGQGMAPAAMQNNAGEQKRNRIGSATHSNDQPSASGTSTDAAIDQLDSTPRQSLRNRGHKWVSPRLQRKR